jgi:hypothetical protein
MTAGDDFLRIESGFLPTMNVRFFKNDLLLGKLIYADSSPITLGLNQNYDLVFFSESGAFDYLNFYFVLFYLVRLGRSGA